MQIDDQPGIDNSNPNPHGPNRGNQFYTHHPRLSINKVTLIIMIKYDLQSCTKFAGDQSILWPRRGWSTQLWGSSEYSSTVSSCLCSTERGITWSTASMSWFGLSIYSPEPTSCLIDNTLQDGYFLQVDVFMPGELESLQCQLRQKFAQESVLNKYFRYILNLNLNKFALL